MRIQEYLITIQRQFKTLRAIYTRVNDDCAGMEYTHIEVRSGVSYTLLVEVEAIVDLI